MPNITLSKKSFNNNANYYSDLLTDVNKLCIALKDNAYGHGIDEIAELSIDYGIKHCIVRDIREAKIALKYNFKSILILYGIPDKTYETNIIFSVNSLSQLNSYPQYSKVELKIDTGMNRNGIKIYEIEKVIDLIEKKQIILNGIFTHFHSADEYNNSLFKQEDIFLTVVKKIQERIKTPFRIHCSNTAAMHKINHSKYDMVRLGIGIYGYSKDCQKYLLPVMSLYAYIISSRIANKDDGIGYGSKFKIKSDSTLISNYDVGYGDGFFRLNERKIAYIKNKKQIIGRVSMDSLSVHGIDKTICIFDNVSDLAKVHDTIEYEILTHLMPHIKRTIVE